MIYNTIKNEKKIKSNNESIFKVNYFFGLLNKIKINKIKGFDKDVYR